jgi:hypothetical protein
MKGILDLIVLQYPEEEFTVATGFNDAVIGIDELSMRIIYSITECVGVLMASGMSQEEAEEYFDYNVAGAYVGARTPIWSFP